MTIYTYNYNGRKCYLSGEGDIVTVTFLDDGEVREYARSSIDTYFTPLPS
jgi:hypothetical protein